MNSREPDRTSGLGTWHVKSRTRGFTLLELTVFIVIFSVLATVLLDRFSYYQELAEKAAMESMLRGFKTGLQIHLAELIIENRQAEAGALETENPVRWLEREPTNYGGAYPESPQPGAWYFHEPTRELVYVASIGNRLEIDTGPGPREIRFRTRLVRDRVQAAGGTLESVTSVTLVPVRPYRWP